MNVFIANSKRKNIGLLSEHLLRIDNNIKIIGSASSYKEAISFCQKKSVNINLLFCETYLQDTPAYDISNHIADSSKLIFTSSSKLHAYEAFKANCMDFLLEPFEHREIKNSLIKLQSSKSSFDGINRTYKKRFIIKFGDKIQFRTVENISYIFAEGKMAYIITRQPSRKYIIEYTLDELEKTQLNPSIFYRINRKFIVRIDSIEEARQYVNSRLKLILNPPTDVDMIVSREKVHDFKKWLNL